MSSLEPHLSILRTLLSGIYVLSDAAWNEGTKKFTFRQFTAGTHIVESGQVVTDLHFQITGLARYYYLQPNGKESNKSFSTKGGVLSSISSLVNGLSSTFSIQAMVDSQVLSISYQDFLLLAERHQDWNRLTMKLLEQLAIKKEVREADFLLLSASERYEKFLQEYVLVVDSIPNYHIASYLGITDVALSRIRKRLKLT